MADTNKADMFEALFNALPAWVFVVDKDVRIRRYNKAAGELLSKKDGYIDDEESWLLIESYLKKQWDMDFSHSYCPICYEKEMAKLKYR